LKQSRLRANQAKQEHYIEWKGIVLALNAVLEERGVPRHHRAAIIEKQIHKVWLGWIQQAEDVLRNTGWPPSERVAAIARLKQESYPRRTISIRYIRELLPPKK